VALPRHLRRYAQPTLGRGNNQLRNDVIALVIEADGIIYRRC
jgi:hypothetical protein